MKAATVNRCILLVSLAGMILAMHLWVQKARGFDQGCLGLSKPILVLDRACRDVGELPASHLLGVSNAAWGYAFYLGLSLLSFAKILTSPAWARRLHQAGEAGVVLAAFYSAYLVYEMGFVARTFCVLCLMSAALVVVLFGLHLTLRRRGGFQPVEESRRATELGVATGSFFGAICVLVAVLVFINRIGTRPLNQGSTSGEVAELVGESLPLFIRSEHLHAVQACRFDDDVEPLVLPAVIPRTLPSIGNPRGVPVVAFYDPNCSYCRTEFPEFMRIAERWKEEANFTVVPRVLWEASMLQVQALRLAESSDRYFEVWRRMFARKAEKGMNLEQISALFVDLGLPVENLEKRLAAVRREVLADRKNLHAAGVDLLPAFYVGGRKVAGYNYKEACIVELLERSLDERGENRPP